MKISIAMATYNGANYLRGQLDSFVAQTLLPSELVVVDDDSSDETVLILEDFARAAPFEVRIYRNDVNLGYAQNFSKSLSLCTGDLIFLSDQDDVWFKDKIETTVMFADNYPEMMLFMNDAELMLGDGTPLGLTLVSQLNSLGLSEKDFTPGCCMALRNVLVQLVLPVPSEYFAHDTWISRLASCLEVKKVILSVKQYYRRHGENTSHCLSGSIKKQSFFNLFSSYIFKNQRKYALCRLYQIKIIENRLMDKQKLLLDDFCIGNMINNSMQSLNIERSVVSKRLNILSYPLWIRWYFTFIFLCSGNYDYFSGWKSFFRDTFFK